MKGFCKIYTTGDISINDLSEQLAELLKLKKVSVSGFSATTFDVYISKNDEFDPRSQCDFPDGFLFFRYIVEFVSEVPVFDQSNIITIAEVLNFLWNINSAAVAVCDYEEFLPNKGGYKYSNQFWPVLPAIE